ncbi:glycosyltransferase family 4 protein [Niveibacterium umoris]|uniref:Glycosyltransferase involved in cell wall biosynthesis n=1 Tax=Niveibacterium umoris TaxID=1193620 RepID=A0A840BEZ2_9RHOO|nr:glycosyltransferase family 1 protein [Niveibacterium umoris]MBB4011600.1 glycosyltransferase involved in cell wall biosynthesis [Niveibacterium umoris]
MQSDAVGSLTAASSSTIVVNGRFLGRRATGVDRFAYEVLNAIDSLLDRSDPRLAELEFKVLIPRTVPERHQFRNISVSAVGKRDGQLWEQLDLRGAVKGRLLLSLCNTAPAGVRSQVVVIHDAATAAIPRAFSRGFRWWYRILMPLLGLMSRRIITVSEFSKGELTRRFGIPAKKIDVVIEGGEHILRVPADVGAIARFGLADRPFVLAVSSMAAHKNFRLVLDTIAKLDDPPFDIAIAGGANARVFGSAGLVHSDRVKWLGYVSDGELRALYEGAMCFVFPSLYEGFGIPPLEAMTCGCPVVAARAASIPEVCGDAAVFFDPHNADELAAQLVRVAGDADLRAELVAKGRVQAAKFSWEAAACQVLAACREVAK